MLPFLCGKNAAEEQTLCREVQEAVESGRVTAELREKLGLPGNERVAAGLLRTWAQDGTIARLIEDVQAGQVRGEMERGGGITFDNDFDNDIISEDKNELETFDDYPIKVHEGKQGKHIAEHNNYQKGRSIFYGNNRDAEKLIIRFKGTGEKIGSNKERVDFGYPIGQYVNPITGEIIETTIGIIHYSKTGAHIVPAKPDTK